MRKPKQYDRIHVENFDSEEGVYMEAKKLGFGLMRLPLTDANDGASIDGGYLYRERVYLF